MNIKILNENTHNFATLIINITIFFGSALTNHKRFIKCDHNFLRLLEKYNPRI
jgi:hypothetical protein